MTLLEMLSRPEVKAMYKELVKKYHPDLGGDQEIMKKINIAKDKGDEEMMKLFKKLKGEKTKEEPKYSDIGLDNIKSDMKKYSNWAREIENEFNGTITNKYFKIIIKAEQPKIGKWSLNADVTSLKGGTKLDKRFTIFNIQRFSSKEQFKEAIANNMGL